MKIEKTDKEIIIRLPANWDTEELIDYLRYKELTSKVKVKQAEVDELATSINKKWWNSDKDKPCEAEDKLNRNNLGKSRTLDKNI